MNVVKAYRSFQGIHIDGKTIKPNQIFHPYLLGIRQEDVDRWMLEGRIERVGNAY